MSLNFIQLTEDWAGQRVFLIGGGPSLSGFDFNRLRGKGVVVAINDAMNYVPWAQCVLSIDTVWIRRRREYLRRFGQQKIGIIPREWRGPEPRRMDCLLRLPGPGYSADMGSVYTGNNSGYAALGMSLMRGASEVWLLGYDMNKPGHWHSGYNWRCVYGAEHYPAWSGMFAILAEVARLKGARIINANPSSAIGCFQFGNLDEAIA
jgi:hypothetical protein